MLRDLSNIQLSPNAEIFEKLGKLFSQKYLDIDEFHTTALEHFQNYFSQTKHWYEGYALGFPSTNNGLEAINAVVKRNHTFGERMPLNCFLDCSKKMIESWSLRREQGNVNFIEFAKCPKIGISMWTEGFHFSIGSDHVIQKV